MSTCSLRFTLYYLVGQFMLLVGGIWFCVCNILKFSSQKLDKSVLYMEELNVEIILYVFVYLEVMWRVIFFSGVQKSFIYKLSLSLDLFFVVLFGITLYVIHKNPFDIENLFLESFTIFFRAINLMVRFFSLVF